MKRRSNQKSSVNPLELPSKRNQDKIQPSSSNWHEQGGLMYCNFSSEPSTKVLGFDMDSTLILTKSGKTFPINDDDWKILYPNIASTLQSFESEGYRIVIFTNQKGIKQGKQDKKGMQRKIEKILSELGIKALAMVSCSDDHYRKPCTTMWDFFVKNLNEGLTIDFSVSKYVGDAAGRPATGKRKKDFNDTDLKFALNIGITFETPEKFFLGEKDELPEPEINPRNIKNSGSVFKGESDNSALDCSGIEVVIFVGSPGSGKSTFWKNHLSAYTRVNNDTLKSRDRCLKVMRQSLQEGKSCVIDNTNPTAVVRAEYIKVAKEFKVPVRCFVFAIDKEMAFHLDTLRQVNTHRSHLSSRVGSMPIHKFFKDFERPAISEGFSEIHEIELVGGPFENESDERLFFSYVYS
jgi:bifunctional polynucleotide phosphatase/kinase